MCETGGVMCRSVLVSFCEFIAVFAVCFHVIQPVIYVTVSVTHRSVGGREGLFTVYCYVVYR